MFLFRLVLMDGEEAQKHLTAVCRPGSYKPMTDFPSCTQPDEPYLSDLSKFPQKPFSYGQMAGEDFSWAIPAKTDLARFVLGR